MQDRSQNSRTASLTDLYQLASDEDITVIEADCPECKALSMMSPNGDCYIGIDTKSMKSEREERQYLAHDIGHCVKGAFYNSHSPFSLIEQQEYRADRKAINYLVPKDEMITAMKKGFTEIWQLCEYFDVDPKYIKLALWEYFDKAV